MAEKQEPEYKNVRVKTPLFKRVKARTERTKRSTTKELEALLEDALSRAK